MNGLRFLLLLACAALAPQYLLASPKALFYLTNKPDSIRSFLAHANQVDILVPAWYSVDANGLVWGGPDPLVMQTAKQAHVPVMPIVANAGFDQQDFHKLATNYAAFENMISALIRECEQNGYTGFQFDFEHIFWTDRYALTSLVRQAAAAFHKHGLKLSIATVPNAPGHPGATTSDKWAYANWRGAYDLKAIAASVDLISLMTYDQHTQG
ncbi:MAG: glycosyl hydrolase family 18 protein, partial [Bryobacteraceae bacterium]